MAEAVVSFVLETLRDLLPKLLNDDVSSEVKGLELRLKDMNPVEVDNDFWQEADVNSSGDHPENGNFELFHSDDKSPATLSGLKYVPPFRASASGSATKFHHKHARAKGGSVQENSDNFPMKNSDFFAEERSASSRFLSATRSNSLRSRTSSESSWDGSSVKTSKSAKEKRGKKIFSADVITGQGKAPFVNLRNYGFYP